MLSKSLRRPALVFALGSLILGADLALADTGKLARIVWPKTYLLATGTAAGTYYPVGLALAALIDTQLRTREEFTMAAINTAGSFENLKKIRDGEVQFALAQGFLAIHAAAGTGPFGPDSDSPGKVDSLRAVAQLWPDVEHILLDDRFVKSGTVDDLRAAFGERAAFGREQSGALRTTQEILGALGFRVADDFRLVDTPYQESAELFEHGDVAVISAPGGVPVPAIGRAIATSAYGATLLEFTDEHLARVNSAIGAVDGPSLREDAAPQDLFFRYVIAADTYPGQRESVETLAQPNLLVVRADVSEVHVCWITRTIFDNLQFLYDTHPAAREIDPDKAIPSIPVKLHPGAALYFEGKECPALATEAGGLPGDRALNAPAAEAIGFLR